MPEAKPLTGSHAPGKTLPDLDITTDPGVVKALAADDAIPGVFRQMYDSPFTDSVAMETDDYDVYPVWFEVGEYLNLQLEGPNLGEDLDLLLVAPDGDTVIAWQGEYGSSEVIEGQLTSDEWPTDAYWYVVVWAYDGAPGVAQTYTLSMSFNAPDDNVFDGAGFITPGLPDSGFTTYLDGFSEWDEVYRIYLEPGALFTVKATPVGSCSAGFAPSIFLYGPGTTDVWSDSYEASQIGSGLPVSLSYQVTTAGWYYLDLSTSSEDSLVHTWGNVNATWDVAGPLVFRFFKPSTGTHFYTGTYSERNSVMANLGHIFAYEGVAYRANPLANDAPLHRFFKPSTGTHFYTADQAEYQNVINNLGYLYSYDGPAYNVRTSPAAGATTVYRFYKPSSGTHFYTADLTERDRVINTLGYLYSYEGPVFYVME